MSKKPISTNTTDDSEEIDYSDIPKFTEEQLVQFRPMQEVCPELYAKLQAEKKGKERITIWIDKEVIEAFRERADAEGYGYQTMINQALREHLYKSSRPLDEETLRRVIREELRAIQA